MKAIDIANTAREVIGAWEKAKKEAEYQVGYYTGCIDGLNAFLSRIGKASGEGKSGEDSSTTHSTSEVPETRR